MSEPVHYAVFLFASAIEELGAALEPHLQDGPGGRHVLCSGIDSGGALFEMTIHAPGEHDGVLEFMVPVAMIKLVIAVQQNGRFGFARRPRGALENPVAALEPTAISEPAPAAIKTARSGDVDPTL